MMVFLAIRAIKQPINYYLVVALLLNVGIYGIELTIVDTMLGYNITNILQVMIGPVLFLYVQRFIGEQHSPRYALHAIAPLLNIGVLVYTFYPTEEMLIFYDETLSALHMFLNAIVLVSYMTLMLVRYFKMKWQLGKAGGHRLQWVGALASVYIGFTALSFFYSFIYNMEDVPNWVWLITTLFSTLLLIFIGVQAYRFGILKTTRIPLEHNEVQARWMSLFERLDKAVKAECWFQDAQLKTEDLAKKMNTNSRYISRAVNTGYGDSVTNYLNDLRLELFKEKLKNARNSHFNIDALAMECGFNSKSSFNRFFKLREGITPSAYRTRALG